MVEGGRRARLRRLWQTEPYLQGQVEVVERIRCREPRPEDRGAAAADLWPVSRIMHDLAGNVAEEVAAAVLDCQEPGYLADFIAQNTALRYEDKQADSGRAALRWCGCGSCNGFLARERDVLGYEREMEGKVRDELAQQQKEHDPAGPRSGSSAKRAGRRTRTTRSKNTVRSWRN